ncbi:beta and beta-prime subunits of DNA dependent RNA-polymerase [Linderina pennispora]|uniref:DNA-directed RNA polymerase n=1 Tax=Linderina pennispora TaxID=61395 RepID=A0A1Y1VV78_9FUNG|nr:beta and beta-prime subunits of DNA dependent RNA-polymerase [Linderina pennispora]ORX65187.1 beta and beta-prime subunits of DNA dependent RNA-polymerase [Linderina pennispora]
MPVAQETTNPNFFLGFAASLVPLLHHNAGPRGVFMANMMKQTLDPPPKTPEEIQDTGATKRWNRHDTNFISTLTTRALGRDNYGMNMLVKWACYYGYNIEDGIVVNTRLLQKEDGIIQNKFVLDIDKNDILAASNIKWRSDIYNYDSDGIIREGTVVVDGTLLACKIHITSEGLVIRKPLTAVLDRPSIVQNVIKTEQRIIIITSYKYKLSIGDKLVSTAAQKGVITHAVPLTEKADLIINPCCIPSRMTMGQIWEGVISNYMHEEKVSKSWFFPPFNDAVMTFTNMIKETKNLSSVPCLNDLIPKSGFWYTYNRYFVLSQRIDEKYRVRGGSTENNINPFTNQPQKGRKIKGGLRLGIMERDVLLSYNAKNTMKQLMSRQSDEMECYLCPKCECYSHLEICSLCNIQCTKVTIDKSVINLTNALKNIPYNINPSS